MEVVIVTKEVIKPSSSTVKTFNLSFLDQQLYGAVYNQLCFFYQNTSGGVTKEMVSERMQRLKTSLSEVLTHYYPLAGKTKDMISICIGDDDGAEFLEARVNGTLSQYLTQHNSVFKLGHLVSGDYWESSSRPLLIIKASFFTCGGLAIGINISHRVSDAATFTCFMNAWARTSIRKLNNVSPDFSSSLFFPPSDQLFFDPKVGVDNVFKPDAVTRRFVFSASQIIGLQDKATKLGLQPPSRVQTVIVFLWRTGMKMSASKSGCLQMPSKLSMAINLRTILPPPITDQTFGNLIEYFTVHNHNGDVEISNLVILLKKKIEELRKTYQDKMLQGEKHYTGCLGNMTESIKVAIEQDVTTNFSITSWCRFPLYEADFGWGKPTWVTTQLKYPNCMLLKDTSDGTGIEALVSFAEEDMAVFASNEELLAYATVDPSFH